MKKVKGAHFIIKCTVEDELIQHFLEENDNIVGHAYNKLKELIEKRFNLDCLQAIPIMRKVEKRIKKLATKNNKKEWKQMALQQKIGEIK